MDDVTANIFRARSPLDGGLEVPDSRPAVRQLDGADGGDGSFSIPDTPSNVGSGDSSGTPELSSQVPPTPTSIPKVIIAFNGTFFYCTLYGVIGDEV